MTIAHWLGKKVKEDERQLPTMKFEIIVCAIFSMSSKSFLSAAQYQTKKYIMNKMHRTSYCKLLHDYLFLPLWLNRIFNWCLTDLSWSKTNQVCLEFFNALCWWDLGCFGEGCFSIFSVCTSLKILFLVAKNTLQIFLFSNIFPWTQLAACHEPGWYLAGCWRFTLLLNSCKENEIGMWFELPTLHEWPTLYGLGRCLHRNIFGFSRNYCCLSERAFQLISQ